MSDYDYDDYDDEEDNGYDDDGDGDEASEDLEFIPQEVRDLVKGIFNIGSWIFNGYVGFLRHIATGPGSVEYERKRREEEE